MKQLTHENLIKYLFFLIKNKETKDSIYNIAKASGIPFNSFKRNKNEYDNLINEFKLLTNKRLKISSSFEEFKTNYYYHIIYNEFLKSQKLKIYLSKAAGEKVNHNYFITINTIMKFFNISKNTSLKFIHLLEGLKIVKRIKLKGYEKHNKYIDFSFVLNVKRNNFKKKLKEEIKKETKVKSYNNEFVEKIKKEQIESKKNQVEITSKTSDQIIYAYLTSTGSFKTSKGYTIDMNTIKEQNLTIKYLN